jgi:hypothetical protein
LFDIWVQIERANFIEDSPREATDLDVQISEQDMKRKCIHFDFV